MSSSKQIVMYIFVTLCCACKSTDQPNISPQETINSMKSIASSKTAWQKISYVNQWVNNSAKQGTDYSIWGQEDYWATPYETIAKGAADCEDYAMTKYFLLVDLGIPKERLYLSHVSYIDQEAPHMVLIYQSIEDNGFYVLDNIVEKITASNLRTDLTYKYSFNEIGIWIGRPINFIRNEKSTPHQLLRWQDTLNKWKLEN